MSKNSLLDEPEKEYRAKGKGLGLPDSYDLYKHKNGLDTSGGYAAAVNALYASSRKNTSSYGRNNRIINNKGLHNSGYADYIDDMSSNSFKYGAQNLKDSYALEEAKNRGSYASYLEKYEKAKQSIRDSVMSHLLNNDVIDLKTSVAYGVNAGLSFDDAKDIAQTVYGATRQKITNEILKQTVSLGLDKDGAKMLAIKMGLTTDDAEQVAKEVADLLKYYRSISSDYLDFLEGRS